MACDAPCFVGIADLAFKPVFINAFGRRLTGLPDGADLATLSIPDFFATADRAVVREVVLPTLHREGAWEGEYRFHHFEGGDGAIVKWSAFLLRDTQGEVLGSGWLTIDLTHRLESEARLRENRTRLKAAGDLVGLSSYLWDPRTGAMQWDDRLKALWGLPPGVEPDEALWLQGVHPEDRKRVRAAADAAIVPDGDGVASIEYRVIGLDDKAERWVRTYGETQFEGRAAVAFIGAVLDITNQKLFEAQLRCSEAYLAAILRQLPVGVVVFDTDGLQVLGSAAAERFQLRSMPSHGAASADLWQAFRAGGEPLPRSDYPGARALRGETTMPGVDFLYGPSDGDRIWTRVSAAPLRETNGTIQGVVWIIEDVDEQRRNEALRQESEERFRRFAENSRDVLWIFNIEEDRLEYLSPGFQPTWGVPPETALADVGVWHERVHPDDRTSRAQTFSRVIADGGPITQEYRIVRPDGSVRWIRDTTFPIRNADGRLAQIGGIAHDVSLRQSLCVYIVDPDPRSRDERAAGLRNAGHQVTTFASETAFLHVAAVLAPGCVLVRTDDAARAPFALAAALRTRRIELPLVYETKLDGDVAMAISAMKSGAVDVLAAPADSQAVLSAIASALADVREEQLVDRAGEVARSQIALMSQREREVLEGLLNGGTNKTIARTLGISPRTVEIYRARVMERLGAQTVPEAVMAAAAAKMRPLRGTREDR